MIFEGTKKSIFFGLGLTRAGAANPDIEKLMQLSKLYNCSVDYMVGNKINSKQNEEFKPQSKKKNNIKKYGLAIIFLLILAVSVISVIRLSANDKKTNSTVDFLTDEDSEKITDNDLIIFSDKEKLEKEVGFPVDEFTYFNMENVQFKSYDRIIAILECQEILRRTVKITFYKSRDSFDIVNKYFVKAKSYIFNNQYVKINEKTVCGVDVTLRGYDTPHEKIPIQGIVWNANGYYYAIYSDKYLDMKEVEELIGRIVSTKEYQVGN